MQLHYPLLPPPLGPLPPLAQQQVAAVVVEVATAVPGEKPVEEGVRVEEGGAVEESQLVLA